MAVVPTYFLVSWVPYAILVLKVLVEVLSLALLVVAVVAVIRLPLRQQFL